jgi:hypothetical protein
MAYRILWDQWRFPEDVLFPAGIEKWPVWLVEAIYEFAGTEEAGFGNLAEFVEDPPHVRLTATEPYLKAAKFTVALWPDDSDASGETLVVSDVERA